MRSLFLLALAACGGTLDPTPDASSEAGADAIVFADASPEAGDAKPEASLPLCSAVCTLEDGTVVTCHLDAWVWSADGGSPFDGAAICGQSCCELGSPCWALSASPPLPGTCTTPP